MSGSLEPPRFSGDEPAVTILHVSDVQFGKHHRFADEGGGFDTLLRRLCDDLDLLRERHGLAPDLIALTGDLAEWGMKREFEQVAVFGEGLLKHLRLDPERLLIVPGNHDINRMLCESYFLRCAGEGEEPEPPYWPKWESYVELFGRLYRDVDRYRFTRIEPRTLFEIPSLKVVVAGLNSTIHESHLDADHHGFLGEAQLRWFSDRLAEYERKGWLRVGLVHHNAVRGASVDDENLKDAEDLREILGDRLHVLLHGHTHRGRLEMLGPSLPVISTGSAAVRRDQRPGPSKDQPGEIPNQYQIVRLTRDGLWCAAREYTYERKRWSGDTRVSTHGDRWWYSLDRTWPSAGATFPSASPPPRTRPIADEPVDAERREASEDDPESEDDSEHEDDLLADVIGWCKIREEGKIGEVSRVRHRGPWGHYAKVHERERGIALLGAYQGNLTMEVLDRWIADVHDPFRGRGQAVSRLVVATSAIDPALRSAAQVRGVEVERMIDYQRVLDIAGYSAKLRERLAKDREYPSEYYLEQRMTMWSPIHGSRGAVGGAADWLSAHLLEREGVFALVLGPAGVGKTFLLREVARRLGRQQAITPILVELRNLERAQTIEELAAAQFTSCGVPWHPRAFRRDLEEGRLALLFDGFDELALRVRSAAIPAHFERIYAAAVDRARIVISSRTEHFLSSGQVADLMTPSSGGATPLAGQLERVQRRLVLEVHSFERRDVETYLRKRLGDHAGEARLARLARVHDLVGLARNPRMLGFIVDIPDDRLAQAAGLGESITSDALYRIVVEDAWLAAEAERLNPPGAAQGPTVDALRDAATNLALQLWRDPGGSIRAEDVGAHAGSLLAAMCEGDRDWAMQTARARTLLTRDDRGRIAFIHQTVLEWLVAGRLVDEIKGEPGSGSHLDFGRLNAFMIELLRQKVGDDALARWAEARLASPTTSVAAENARDVLKRLNREASTRAIHRGENLRGQELGGQSLVGAIFDGSDLTGARLIGRDLTGASLTGAQLAHADFSDACLRDADLTGANLAFARFHRADLAGARLTRAQLTGASFVGARDAALDATHSVGLALAAPPSVEAMYARVTWGRCHVAFNPDGTVLASGHGDGTVRLWDWARGKVLRVLAGHRQRILGVAFSPDGRTLASSSEDGTARLWSVGDGTERARLTAHRGRVWSVAFSPDGEIVATTADDGTVRFWSAGDGAMRMFMLGFPARIYSAAFSPDGKTLACAGTDAIVRLWSLEDGTELQRLHGHRGSAWSVAFSPDGKTLVSSGSDGMVRLWDPATGRELARMAEHRGRVTSVAFSPDGKTIASGGADAMVRLWSPDSVTQQGGLTGHRGGIWSVAFSPDGKTVATGSTDVTVRLWSLADGSERARLAEPRGSVWGVVFSPDGRTVASAADDATVRLWNVGDGSERARLAGHGGRIMGVAFSPDGAAVTSCGSDAVVRWWDAWSGSEEERLTTYEGTIVNVAFSPDGRTVAICANDETVRLYNMDDGSERVRLEEHEGTVLGLAFSPDGKTLAISTDDHTLQLWSTEDGTERATLGTPEWLIWDVAFSPDSTVLAAAADDGTVRLWSTEDWTERGHLAGHSGRITSVAFSPDGRMVASAGIDATVRLWSVEEPRELACLNGHSGRVLSVAFSPDGTLVVSGAADATVRLWDVATGRCLAILCGTPGGSVAARPDGRYRVRGDVAGQFWHVIGLHRYEVGELDELIPGLRLADGEPLYTRP